MQLEYAVILPLPTACSMILFPRQIPLFRANLFKDTSVMLCFQGYTYHLGCKAMLFQIKMVSTHECRVQVMLLLFPQWWMEVKKQLEQEKSRKSRNTWSNRQIWPWSTEWNRARIIEFCQENTLVIANTIFQQHKRRLYTWTSPDGQY